MSNPNIPKASSEAVEKKKKFSESSMNLLIRSAVRMRLGKERITSENLKREYVADPRQVDSLKYDKIAYEIQENMRLLLDQYGEEFDGINQDDLEDVSESRILRLIHEKVTSLKHARASLIKNIHKTFKGSIASIPQITSLPQKVAGLDENQIADIERSPKSMQKFLEKTFNIDVASLKITLPSLQEVFPDIDQVAPHLKKYLLYVIEQYEVYGELPHKNFIGELFLAYADMRRRKEIARYFDVDFTMKELVEYGVYDEHDIRKAAEEYIGHELWGKLNDEDKKTILTAYRNNDSVRVDIDDHLSQKIEVLAEGEQEKLITGALFQNIERVLGADDE